MANLSGYPHQGMRELSGDEIASSSLGQSGFKIISNTTVECGVTSGYEDIKFFIAIKAIEDNANVNARSLIGDDLSQNGVFSGTALTMIESDIIHGNFDKITVASGDYVLAYIGR